jgi:hypothetical protein
MKKGEFRKAMVLLAAVAIWTGASTSALAALTFTGSSGTFAATATFDVVGGNLQITLANTSLADVTAPTAGGGILTALFFDLAPTTTLTPVSATLGAGSTVFFGLSNGGNVGGEWAYGGGLSGAPGNAGLGVSSSGFGLFGQANFNGQNLQGPACVDGLQYGITSAGDNTGTGNAAVTGNFALIKNSVVFTLSGDPAFTTIDDYTISHVSFQYGTALSDAHVPAVPEPTTMIAGALLLLPFGASTLRMLRKSRKA